MSRNLYTPYQLFAEADGIVPSSPRKADVTRFLATHPMVVFLYMWIAARPFARAVRPLHAGHAFEILISVFPSKGERGIRSR